MTQEEAESFLLTHGNLVPQSSNTGDQVFTYKPMGPFLHKVPHLPFAPYVKNTNKWRIAIQHAELLLWCEVKFLFSWTILIFICQREDEGIMDQNPRLWCPCPCLPSLWAAFCSAHMTHGFCTQNIFSLIGIGNNYLPAGGGIRMWGRMMVLCALRGKSHVHPLTKSKL